MSIIENTAQTPVDVLDYIPGGRGMPRWVYVDPERVSFTLDESTRTLCVWWDHQDRTAAGHGPVRDNIDAFDEYAQVLGNVYHSFYRQPEWPKNLFYYEPNPEIIERNVEVTGWAANKVRVDLPDEVVPEGDWYTAPSNVAFPIDQLDRDRETNTNAADPIDASDAMELLREPSSWLPTWVFWDPSESHETLDLAALCQDALITIHADEEHPTNRDNLFDPEWLAQGHLPLFRRAYWPDGLFRVAGVIRYDDGEGPRRYQVPTYFKEPGPNAEALSIRRPAVRYPTAAQFIHARVGLIDLARQPGRRIRSTHWIQWDVANGEGDHSIHLTPSDGGYRIGDPVPGIAKSPSAGVISLYRHRHWPLHTWSAVWDGEEPFFKDDAFGPRQNEEADTSTYSNPVEERQNFQYPKWIKPNWHSTLSAAADKRYIVVNVSHNRATVGSMGDHHPITHWTDTERPKKAVYFRQRSFPTGVYRRMDLHKLTVRSGRIRVYDLVQDDEPCKADAPEPWHSQTLTDWIAQLSERMGRPIFTSPEEGTPFLAIENPALNRNATGFRFKLQDREIQAYFSGSVHVDAGRASNLSDDHNTYHWGAKYRTGVRLNFDPCMIHYVAGQEGVEGDALSYLLAQIEDFFANYEDPDITEELAEQVWNRVSNRVQRFDNDVMNAQQTIERRQRDLDSAVQTLQQIYERRSFFADLSQAKFRSILRRHRRLVERQGALVFDSNRLNLKMEPFEIEGQEIGPLLISMTLNETAFRVHVKSANTERARINQSQHGYCHPHVDKGNGRICWGTGGNIASDLANGFDPLEYLFATANFLKDGYHAAGAYVRIDQWRPRQVWWCEHCEAEHPNGEQCPQYCSHCGEYVDMDEHEHCTTHRRCWNNLDDDDCPQCAEASEQAQAS
jgi:hypothetical protein